MTNKEYLAQTLGTNDEAQAILTEVIADRFAELETNYEISETIIAKFYDWGFTFPYTTDGGGAKRWRGLVRAMCARNQKLKVLNALYDKIGGDADGEHAETWSGQDKKTTTKNPVSVEKDFTDNLARETKTDYSAVGNTSTEALADRVTTAPVESKNTQKEKTVTRYEGDDVETTEKGTRRTYSDGRTIAKIMEDAENVAAPVYEFINEFAAILVEPCACECYNVPAPSVQMSVGEVKEGDLAAELKNDGTPMHARYVLDLTIPKGKDGKDGVSISEFKNYMYGPTETGYTFTEIDVIMTDGTTKKMTVLAKDGKDGPDVKFRYYYSVRFMIYDSVPVTQSSVNLGYVDFQFLSNTKLDPATYNRSDYGRILGLIAETTGYSITDLVAGGIYYGEAIINRINTDGFLFGVNVLYASQFSNPLTGVQVTWRCTDIVTGELTEFM